MILPAMVGVCGIEVDASRTVGIAYVARDSEGKAEFSAFDIRCTLEYLLRTFGKLKGGNISFPCIVLAYDVFLTVIDGAGDGAFETLVYGIACSFCAHMSGKDSHAACRKRGEFRPVAYGLPVDGVKHQTSGGKGEMEGWVAEEDILCLVERIFRSVFHHLHLRLLQRLTHGVVGAVGAWRKQ